MVTQKQILLQEVHHRVKNNFQIMSSLLNLQERLENNQRSKHVLNELKGRIRSMSLVHELLYHTNNFEAIEFSNYVKQLVESIKESYGLYMDKININIQSEAINFSLEKTIPIVLILNERITNSIKYAFKASEGGNILVKMTTINSNTYELVLKDNGIGIPEEILPDTSENMGLDFIKILSDQIDGQVRIENNNGVEITIRFKV